MYQAQNKKVKIGHQAITYRNRIVNDLWELKDEFDFDLEIVDETSTTRYKHNPDMNAALDISFLPGKPVTHPLSIHPTDGEIRDLQRMSRIKSDSRITISKELARRVAEGDIDISQAIDIQKNHSDTGTDGEGDKKIDVRSDSE